MKKITPVIFRIVPEAETPKRKLLSAETVGELGLVGYAEVDRFRSEHTERGARATTSTWKFLANRAFFETGLDVTPDYLHPDTVKQYLFTPSFVIAKAGDISDCYNRPGRCWDGISAVSGQFLIDVANQFLHADPGVPTISR